MSWETKMSVAPLCTISRILRKHFCEKKTSPTASASSMIKMSGWTFTATANASRSIMPDE